MSGDSEDLPDMQKLSRVKTVKYTTWGDRPVMTMNATLGAKVAQCIAAWSEIETLLGMFLGVILHANQNAALAMYSTVENRSAQLRMIEVAAQANLVQDASDVISIFIATRIRPAMKLRDKLAHWVWGYADELPEALLIREPSASIKDYAEVIKTGNPRDVPADHDKIFALRENDLDRYISNFRDVNLNLRVAMASVIISNPPHEREQYLRQLSNTPAVQKGLDRLREARQKNQATPEPAP